MTDPQIQWERHEGMVTVYREDGTYAGCMGAERWERLLREDEASRVTDPAAHTPSDPAGAPDVEALAQTVRKALIRSFDVRGSGVLHPNDIAILHALSDLTATARENKDYAGYGEILETLTADRDRLRERLEEWEEAEGSSPSWEQVDSANQRFVDITSERDRLARRVAELEAALRMAEGSTLKAAQLLPMTLSTSKEKDHLGDHASWAGWLLRHKVLPVIRAALAGDGGAEYGLPATHRYYAPGLWLPKETTPACYKTYGQWACVCAKGHEGPCRNSKGETLPLAGDGGGA